jgi:hypothetical protein
MGHTRGVKKQTLEKWVWVLVYGGMLLCSWGIFVFERDAVAAGWLWGGGGVAVAMGVWALVLRARMHGD